jgi:2-amino-4-hydroxy-6-hydroxymethyldihydropteridine diphosphokinase
MPYKATLSLGSNIEPRLEYLQIAVKQIKAKCGDVQAISDVFETEPWGFESSTPFLNCVLLLNTEMQPLELLEVVRLIEKSSGRQRNGSSYASRTLDVDVLFIDSLVFATADLTVPHPRLHLRKFVLQPLCQIQPLFEHPVLQKSVNKLFEDCKDNSDVNYFASASTLSIGIG